MDHTKLVIFVLIVLGTVATFGSPITEDYPEDYSGGPEEFPELSPNKTKELDTLKSDPDMGIFHEMTRNSKEHEALMRSDPALGNYPEMVSNSKELDTLKSDPDMGIFHEMTRNSKEHEALLRSDPALGNYPEMVPNSKEIEALRMRSNQSNPATEMTPEFQEHGELLSNSSDQDGKIVKRVDPGTVIAGAQLAFDVIKSVLNALASISRKIAIGIDNESHREWKAIKIYFYSGTSDVNIPYKVNSGKALLWGARKTRGSVRGAVGVLTYWIPSIYKTLAVMYSVPYNYHWYSNWWNVKLYFGYKRANHNMFNDMYYYSNPFKGDNSWHGRYLGSSLTFRGAMASSGEATLEIKVYR